jgi:hypothetical protein
MSGILCGYKVTHEPHLFQEKTNTPKDASALRRVAEHPMQMIYRSTCFVFILLDFWSNSAWYSLQCHPWNVRISESFVICITH